MIIERINYRNNESIRDEIELIRNRIQAFQTRMKHRQKEEKLKGFIHEVAAKLGFKSPGDEDELWHFFN